MASGSLSVKKWAETVPQGGLKLRDLDLLLLRHEPGILKALGWSTANADDGGPVTAKRLIAGLAFFMPYAGVAAYVGGYDAPRRIEAEGLGDVAWIVALACFVLAVWGPPVVAARWWRSGRQWDWLELLYLGTTVPACVATLKAMSDDSAGPEWLGRGWVSWLTLPVWWTLLAATVVLVAQVFSRGRRDAVPDYFRRTGPADPALAEQLIARLDPARVRHLLQQRAEAVASLQRRGLISVTEATDLTSRPLGRFHDDVYT